MATYADDFMGPIPGGSPFQDLTKGSATAQSVDAYRAGNPALWGNMYAAIQTGQYKIGPTGQPVADSYDDSGNPQIGRAHV